MKKLAVGIIFWICSLPCLAQPEMANWYFGDKAGIRFLDDTVVALTDGQMVASEGCATISDRQGRLLFYSNGVQVWGKDHQVLPNGSGLLGHHSSTQSALFVPHPETEGRKRRGLCATDLGKRICRLQFGSNQTLSCRIGFMGFVFLTIAHGFNPG